MKAFAKPIIGALLITLCAVSISACSIYRLGSRQGNEVNAEKLAELENALTREQVIEIMGSPLVNDPFRNNRWDYVYYYKKHDRPTKLRRISVFFNEDLVDRIEHEGINTEDAAEPSEADTEGTGPES